MGSLRDTGWSFRVNICDFVSSLTCIVTTSWQDTPLNSKVCRELPAPMNDKRDYFLIN